jgi:hypothetical protein
MASTRRPRHSKRHFAKRGEAIFETNVRPNLVAKDYGRFVAIDIETGDFEIAVRELTACDPRHRHAIWVSPKREARDTVRPRVALRAHRLFRKQRR